ncbi:Panacea domain-containing protein [Roseateles chitinivorans]|uniref:Panacea domain-containing protein n=1 Tax=Roseateles chitinivorans TaxID=2917965 RepID=UPI003D67F341
MTTPPISAQAVAAYFLHFFEWKRDPINNYKLQKLLYYVQGWHLAEFDEPAFPERLEACFSGPVCPAVFDRYSSYTWRPITEETAEPEGLPDRLIGVMERVLDLYGFDTGWSLEYRTHHEPPWQTARRGLDLIDPCNEEITHASMAKFFKAESAAMKEAQA